MLVAEASNAPRAVYVHVPFCRRRCGYCSFTLVADRGDLVRDYLRAIAQELQWIGPRTAVSSLYFGGGTPTYLEPAAFRELSQLVRDQFSLLPDYEWSVEANPSDITTDYVKMLVEVGVTRLSLGAQSFNAEKLTRLERDHTAETIEHAYRCAREQGLAVSLDLIFAAPDESYAAWLADLHAALALFPDHISTYGLTFERGALFWGRKRRGDLESVPEETERMMYEAAIDLLTAAGYEHYEVSNFALPGHRCRHNEVYWTGEGYHAVGPGAASYINGSRRMNHPSTFSYLRRVLSGQSPVIECETLPKDARARERIVFGLRRLEGVTRREFQASTGTELDALAGDSLRRYTALGLLEDDGQRVRLTRAGLLISDSLWPEML